MTKKLSISLPDKMDAAIEELVAQGIFSTKTAVIEEGLRTIFMKYSYLDTEETTKQILERLQIRKHK